MVSRLNALINKLKILIITKMMAECMKGIK